MQDQLQTTEPASKQFPRLDFASRFYLYAGLFKYIQAGSNSAAIATTKQPLAQLEGNLMGVFGCDPDWPVCLFDFTHKNKNPTYLCLRVSNLTQFCIEEYFYGPSIQTPPADTPLVIERNPHLCTEPYFVDNFKMLYQACDPLLLEHPCLDEFSEDISPARLS